MRGVNVMVAAWVHGNVCWGALLSWFIWCNARSHKTGGELVVTVLNSRKPFPWQFSRLRHPIGRPGMVSRESRHLGEGKEQKQGGSLAALQTSKSSFHARRDGRTRRLEHLITELATFGALRSRVEIGLVPAVPAAQIPRGSIW